MSETAERDAALRESWDCTQCGGHGMLPVYHREYDGNSPQQLEVQRYGEVRMQWVVTRTVAHCSCQLGQWMRRQVDEETRRRVPCVIQIRQAGDRARWLLFDPTDNGEELTWEQVRRSKATNVVQVKAPTQQREPSAATKAQVQGVGW